ncbi:dihydroorotate dehydrogenase [Salisediminibacterium selenitireducens]|uniref:Dihydroorotate dehydrogenase n=1 Tax=Bacillus selenitireducens (strain ATCC 700615 / DSM 15326 / MLS10) TaxID=439292 RepID=D6XTQ0_BACIE|nr:dihydroorotate dehydrogenase [Salisediminibacterium selenitireducens]ADH99186.1 dihydroorotate dehydrogenase family protein [[Bacillus] selenitireducens MLS10]
MNRLAVDLPGMPMNNPVLPASGCFGFGEEYGRFYDLNRLGAITVKAVTAEKRLGNAVPRIDETEGGMLNAIGLQNPGVDHVITHELEALKQFDIPVLVNIAGNAVEDYVETSRKVAASGKASALELNISCPNVKIGGMQFGSDPAVARELTRAVKEVIDIPLYVKLSPNVTDIVAMAKAVEAGGADGLSMINTLVGMTIDVQTGQPVLANKRGGLSGPAIKPVAIRMIYDVSQEVSIPIIGMGGVQTVDDIIEFMMAGASAVAVGTANFQNPMICPELIDGLETRLDELGYQSVRDIIGRSWSPCSQTLSL